MMKKNWPAGLLGLGLMAAGAAWYLVGTGNTATGDDLKGAVHAESSIPPATHDLGGDEGERLLVNFEDERDSENSPVSMPAVPKRYRLPELEVGMTTGTFLSSYWGARRPEVREALGGDRRQRSFDRVMQGEQPLYRPLGDVEDFFDGLEERTVKQYRQTQRRLLYAVPGATGASYLDDGGMLEAVLSSSVFNPFDKKLDLNSRQSLNGFLQENALAPSATAGLLSSRWEEILRSCTRAIIAYEPVHTG